MIGRGICHEYLGEEWMPEPEFRAERRARVGQHGLSSASGFFAAKAQRPQSQRRGCSFGIGEFRLRHPFFAEIFVTDARGQIIGATGKTSDYCNRTKTGGSAPFTLAPIRRILEGVHF